MRSLNDLKIKTRRPIVIANWTNEEGSRYAPAMISSGVFAGVFTKEFAYSRLDADNKTLGDELERIGFKGAEPIGGWPIHASFELHIEQGPILEDETIDVGVVTHGQGQRWYEIRLTGFESHAGSTPMPRRKDALLGAARIVELVNRDRPLQGAARRLDLRHAQSLSEFAQRHSGRGLHDLRVPPSDRRDADRHGRGAARPASKTICETIGLTYDLKQVFYYPPVAFDAACVAAVRRAAEHFGYSHRDIVSGAGHDACYIARVAPTSMIFTPCVDGVSHNEAEDIKQEWSTAGANVLMHAVLEKAEIVD